MQRREFLKSALALPVVAAVSLPASGVFDSRPPISGIFGKTYFSVGLGHVYEMGRNCPGKKLFLDGKNIQCVAFEADLDGQWVGVLWEKFNGLATPYKLCTRRWIKGKVELRQIDKPHNPERYTVPQGGIVITFLKCFVCGKEGGGEMNFCLHCGANQRVIPCLPERPRTSVPQPQRPSSAPVEELTITVTGSPSPSHWSMAPA